MTFFGLQNLKLIDFTKIFQFKGLKPKKGHSNFYECCDLTKKVGISSADIMRGYNRRGANLISVVSPWLVFVSI